MRFEQKDAYYCDSSDPAGYRIAKAFDGTKVSFLASKDKMPIGEVVPNFRAALKQCVDSLSSDAQIGVNDVDLQLVSRNFRSSTSPIDAKLFRE